jgi:PAS domain S-box-containing protein
MKKKIESKELILTEFENSEPAQNRAQKNLQSAVDKFENISDNHEESCPGWQETFDAALDIIALISKDFEILKINKTGYENIDKKPEELIGKKCYEVVHGLNSPIEGCPCAEALKTKTSGDGEIRDHGRVYMTTASPILDKNNEIIAFAHTVKDITEQKKAEKLLQDAQKNLERKVRERTADLDRKTIALQEIIAHIEIEKKRMKENIKANIEKIIFPILGKMKKEKNSETYVTLLMHHLKDLVSSYGIIVANGSTKLTPREIEICNMVKAALTNKEIANLLNISSQTVEWHRKKIRQKLGIVNNGINLSSYLHEL